MLIAYGSLLFVKALLSSCKISSCNFACVSAFPRLSTPFNVTAKYRFYARFCAMAEPNATTRLGSDTQRTYQVVVAATRDMGIGKDGKLPWRLPSDLKFFKELTMATSDPGKKNAVVMGRKTWESIPPEYRPLRGRLNVVLTRSGTGNYCVENVVTCQSIPLALQLLAKDPYCLSIENVFVIGGGQILREALNAPGCDAIYITEIETSIECDTFIPSIDFSLFYLGYSSPPIVENNIRFSFVTYIRVRNSVSGTNAVSSEVKFNGRSDSNKFEVEKFKFLPNMIFQRHDEYRYLRMVQEIISSGTEKDDRTRTGSVSKFGCQMQLNPRRPFPFLTTKRMFWEGVVEELLWLISGSTNAKVLEERGIHIWDGNASRGYVVSNGLAEREDDDLGDPYMDFRGDILVPGFDQLSDVIDKIKHRPDDRRIIFSAWNPCDLKLMALPPCHMFAQFYVANEELFCQIYQQSGSMDLGVPFNIASYALLTCMIVHVCEIVPDDFIHATGNVHVSRTHIRPFQEQLQKHPKPKPFPILRINL